MTDIMHNELLRTAAAGISGRNRRRVGSCSLPIILLVLVVASAAAVVRFYFVHLQLRFTESPAEFACIDYYNRPGLVPPIDQASTAINSFDWFVYASDALDILPLLAVPGSLLIAQEYLLPSVTPTGMPLFMTLIALVQAAKSVYFSLYFFSLFGLNCAEYAFCINHDLGTAASTPDISFAIELFTGYGLLAVSLLMLYVPSIYQSGQRRMLAAGMHYANAASKKQVNPVEMLAPESGSRMHRRKKRQPTTAASAAASSMCGDSADYGGFEDEDWDV